MTVNVAGKVIKQNLSTQVAIRQTLERYGYSAKEKADFYALLMIGCSQEVAKWAGLEAASDMHKECVRDLEARLERRAKGK